MRISVAGTGYVGLSIATLLAQHNDVTAVDIVQERVDMVNRRQSPIQDDYIERFFAEDVQLREGAAPSAQDGFMLKKPLSLNATTDWEKGYKDSEFVVIAAPTNYDSAKNFFDTSAVEDVIGKVMKVNPKAVMVIKSTIPVGYTEAVSARMGSDRIIFAPEFLRESKALYDNLYPSRIIVGQGGCADTVYGHHGGRGGEAFCQHLPGTASELFQRVGHLCRNQGLGHSEDNRGRVLRPANRLAL